MRTFKKTVNAEIREFCELKLHKQNLLEWAAKTRLCAQAPYSRYLVGAAVLSEDNTIHCGCNVERCSFTQTTHAEQNAIDSMITQLGPVKIKAVAIVAAPQHTIIPFPPKKIINTTSHFEKIGVPCGHCLQIIWENCFEDPEVEIIIMKSTGEIFCTTIGDALPMRFGPRDLGIEL